MDSGQQPWPGTPKPSHIYSPFEASQLLSTPPTQTTWGDYHNKPRKIGGHCNSAIPLNPKILAKLGTMAASSCSEDSEQNLLFDITCLGRFIGPIVSEYAQTSPNKVNYHTWPSGTKVIKAFIANDFVFYNKAGDTIDLVDTTCLD